MNSEYLDLAKRVALGAGAILRDGFYSPKKISTKGGRELLTSIDIISEQYIIAEIRRRYPDHFILAEESGGGGTNYVWIIDPLDGTNNFAHSFPFFAVSIALARNNRIILGVIYDPLRDELFWADENGAYLNGNRITVSNTKTLKESFLATGFPYDLSPTNENNLDYFEAFSYASLGIRRAGSAALDLAYVACGRFDGFWELKLKVWDMAAGSIIVEKAGGKVTDFHNNIWQLSSDRIIASNSLIHEEMFNIIKNVNENRSNILFR